MAVDEKTNSQALVVDTRKAQALDDSKASDKKPDLRQVLSDSIGDFKRLSGILQKLQDFLPKHTEALNSAYKKVAEVVKTNNGIINGVKATVTELQSEVSRLDATIDTLDARLEKKLDSKLAQHEKKVGAEIEKLLAYRKSDRAVIWMLFIVCLISMFGYSYLNYLRRSENRAMSEKIDRLLERQESTENTGEESSPKAKPEKKTPAKSKR